MFRGPLRPSQPPPVTASAVDRAFLAPGMEARAHNLDQYDPSPGVDSSLERIRALALKLPPSSEREALVSEIETAIASNCHEGEAELTINGAADQLVTDLRRIERSGENAAALSAKAIARHLREPLACIGELDGRPVAELTAARDQLRHCVATVPHLMLLSGTVRNELGKEKFAVLQRFAQKDGAARSEPAGAAIRSEGSRHGES